MMPVLRRAMPVLMAALALAHTGCGSKSEKSTPTGPQPPASGDEGRFTAMAEPYLGTAANFAVLAGSIVTCPVASTITGDVGVSPGIGVPPFITGFPPCTTTGSLLEPPSAADGAHADLVTAYNTLDALPCSSTVGPDLTGLALVPGVYCVPAGANLTGALVLNGGGNPNAVWVFQMESTLITSAGSSVSVIGASGCGVQWLVRSSATIQTGTTFVGNIVALTSITLNGGSSLSSGRALARNGQVTLNGTTVNQAACLAATVPPPFPLGAGGVPALPHGMEWVLLVILVGTGTYILRRH